MTEQGTRRRNRSSSRSSTPPRTSSSARQPRSRRSTSPANRKRGNSVGGTLNKSSTMEGETPNWKKDKFNLLFLLGLYILQGIPMGLASVMPLYLQEKGADYSQQAKLSFISWPYSIKLLWAPIVDSVYSKAFGRRKSWVVPTQLLVGIMLVGLSGTLGNLMEEEGIHIQTIALLFFSLYFLVATQDIAVDGWALTILSRENVSYASTVNAVGQQVGYVLSFVGFTTLNNANVCDSTLRPWLGLSGSGPLITLPQFMTGCGVIFLVFTALVAVLKTEAPTGADGHVLDSSNGPRKNLLPSFDDNEDEGSGDDAAFHPHSIRDTYAQLFRIVRLPSVVLLTTFLLTMKVGIAPLDSATHLELMEIGIPKEHLVYMGSILMPFELLFPVFASKLTNGPRPLSYMLLGLLIRVIFGIFYGILGYVSPILRSDQLPGWDVYTAAFCISFFYRIGAILMFVSVMSFFARISDPRVGGAYMTLLNTIMNFSSSWPGPIGLTILNYIDRVDCLDGSGTLVEPPHSHAFKASHGEDTPLLCGGHKGKALCEAAGGSCQVIVEGYSILAFFAVVYSAGWLLYYRKKVFHLQKRRKADWRVTKNKKSVWQPPTKDELKALLILCIAIAGSAAVQLA